MSSSNDFISKKQFYITDTLFHTVVALTLAMAYKNKNVYLVVSDRLERNKQLCDKIDQLGLFKTVYYLPSTKMLEIFLSKGKIKRSLFRKKFWRTQTAIEMGDSTFFETIKDAQLNVFDFSQETSRCIINNFPQNFIRMMEDGMANYADGIGKLKKFRRKYILRTQIGGGHDKEVKEIWVQYPEKVVDAMKPKARKLELKRFFKELAPTDKSKLLGLFQDSISEDDLRKHAHCIFISQPLSEDGYLTEEQKIKLYLQLIEKHGKGKPVLLKMHPREKTDYTKHLPKNVTILSGAFPFEILNFMDGIHFKKAVTVFSGSVKNFDHIDEVVSMGMDGMFEWKKNN